MQPIVVFDTNILISARGPRRGKCFQCLSLAKQGAIASITCAEILEEFRDKLVTKFNYDLQRALNAVNEIRSCSQLVTVSGSVRGVVADPDDDKIIECAVVGQATHIVTGDKKHLLPLGSYQGIQIITAADLLALVTKP